ncbi:DNA repair protein RadC [Gloeomargarita lithophora Alchichica-D10]|uniref:DNA repair protein RadC n=1 Tax=Gloeomargarita lithophora Alchichica-D10 TaxID=1188229 RepID=A0A1J0AH77_9CYAN|nr:DNA repair protein RadC [Gloeomargarita lithophora]APB35298.1 DNA repair protein RadC [Gloeomargarita lithophora Alchichica-D10]
MTNSYRLRICDLPATERPRERLLQQGVTALGTGELLAILLGTGSGKLSAVGLGQYLLQELGRHQQDALAVLREIKPAELMTLPGIGPAKATTILAAIELGKRVFLSRPLERTPIDSPELAVMALAPDLMWAETERFALLLLDVKHRLLGSRVLTIGTVTETLAHPREIFREAIRLGATRLIVGHNHPSGNVTPSTADLELTGQLLQCSKILDIPVLDHLILGQGNHCSLRSSTRLWEGYESLC